MDDRSEGPAESAELEHLGERLVQLAASNGSSPNTDRELQALSRRLRRGLRNTQREIERTQRWVRHCLARLEALTAVLEEQGVVAQEALTTREQRFLSALVNDEYSRGGLGVALDRRDEDKYKAPEATVDCDGRWPVCRAICCYILSFAISKQDVTEGVVRWDADWPYRIAREPDAKCVHLNRETCQCTLREHRPRICRTYTCRRDRRIWKDFDGMVLSDWVAGALRRIDLRSVPLNGNANTP